MPKQVIITRPIAQAENLSNLLKSSGFSVYSCPLLEIKPIIPAHGLSTLRPFFPHVWAVLFISPNAVQYGFASLQAENLNAHYFAVGLSTARALYTQGVKTVIVPTIEYNSEGLLALPALQQVQGKIIAIIRGGSGMDLLGNTLQKRGAIIHYIECYHRTRPVLNIQTVLQQWQSIPDTTLICTSIAALDHLAQLFKDNSSVWQTTTLVVSSERLSLHARQLGHCGIIILAKSALNEDLVRAIV